MKAEREGLPREEVACALCNSREQRVVYEAQLSREDADGLTTNFRASGDDILTDRLVRCANCGLIYVSPRIRSDLVVKAYTEGSDESFVSQAAQRERTFERSFRLLERHTSNGAGRILDVGTGSGAFLRVAQKYGWEIYGCEPNRWLCQWIRQTYGMEVQPGALLDQHYPREFFSVLTLWDILEHTPDPRAVLEESHRILRPRGLLVVNYPDIGSWIAKLMRRRWVFLLQVHLYYFTRKTISALLAGTGFEVVEIRPHFQTLSLGYVVGRIKPYSDLLYRTAKGLIEAVGLERVPFTYWMGQTLVIARKCELK